MSCCCRCTGLPQLLLSLNCCKGPFLGYFVGGSNDSNANIIDERPGAQGVKLIFPAVSLEKGGQEGIVLKPENHQSRVPTLISHVREHLISSLLLGEALTLQLFSTVFNEAL